MKDIITKEHLQEIIKRTEMLFVELTGRKPFTYQIKFLRDKSNRIIFRSGRQVGKTEACAIKAISHALSGDRRLVLNLASNREQSGILFRRIRNFLKSHPSFNSMIVSDSQTMVVFKNGSEIHCLPGNNPEGIRGYSPSLLIIDEAAFVKPTVFEAIIPSLAATDGDLIYISTPYGKRGDFYNAWNNIKFSQHYVKSKDCPNITDDFLQEQADSRPKLQYLQEYEGEFIEEADAFFPRELILNCMTDCRELESADTSMARREYYLGVDCARYGLDETVYTILEKNQTIEGDYYYEVVKIIPTEKKPMTDIVGRVKNLNSSFNFRKIYIDETGIGSGPVDTLKEDGLPIEGIIFTLQKKEEMYNNLKLLMQKKELKIPNNEKLLNQMADLQYDFTSNHLRIYHPEGGHDDYPDSLALVCLCAKTEGEYHPYFAI